MNNVIIVWKDGSYKEVEKSSSWEFENDENWLVTISIVPDKELIEKALVVVENNEQVFKLFQSSVALYNGAASIKDEVSKIEEFIVNVFSGKDIDTNKLNSLYPERNHT